MQEQYENQLQATIQSLIYDCEDPALLARFYAKLLGGVLEEDAYGAYTVQAPGSGIVLGFQADAHYTRPVWLGKQGDQQQMLHIDIQVADRKQAIQYALSIGATLPEQQFCQPDWEIQWVTMLDPAGHPFCLWEK